MLVLKRYQVIEDGTVIDNDTGRVMWPVESRNGKQVKPYHMLKGDDGKFHYFSVKYLMDGLGVDYEEEIIVEEESEFVNVTKLQDDPAERMKQLLGIVEDF
jgi:hypothetical protein